MKNTLNFVYIYKYILFNYKYIKFNIMKLSHEIKFKLCKVKEEILETFLTVGLRLASDLRSAYKNTRNTILSLMDTYILHYSFYI